MQSGGALVRLVLVRVRAVQVRRRGQGFGTHCSSTRLACKVWRIWKSVVGGIIAGSGVDWAADTKLLEVVMDEEDEIR